MKIRLQGQPVEILMMLLEHPGEVITREELQKKLWPADTFVDFERGLNRAINKLRGALADDAEAPRYIETLPRRGYRFRAPVDAAEARGFEAAGRSQLAIVSPDTHHQAEDLHSDVRVPKRQVLPWVVTGIVTVIALGAVWRPWRAPVIAAER